MWRFPQKRMQARWPKAPIVNDLDFVILGATEIDTDFNVNVITDSNGRVISGAGGHGDTAEGAKMTVITAPLYRNKYPTIVDHVSTVTTPGRFVDLFVCQEGIAVNTALSRNVELASRLKRRRHSCLGYA